MWEIGKNRDEAIRDIGIVEIDEVIDQVKGVARGLAPANSSFAVYKIVNSVSMGRNLLRLPQG